VGDVGMKIEDVPTAGDLMQWLVDRGVTIKDAHDAVNKAMVFGAGAKRARRETAQGSIFGDSAIAPPKPAKPKKVKRRWPDDFTLTDELIRFAKERGFERGQHVGGIDWMWGKFRNRNLSRGEEYADWNAAWRTWVMNQVEYRNGGGRQGPGSVSIPHPDGRI
jgi:hypothetical protein